MVTTRGRRVAAVVTVILASVCIEVLLAAGPATADASEPVVATATTQDLLAPEPGLSVVMNGKKISALPFRLRLLNQASPLAYSLDLRRVVSYGDSWSAISLGRPGHDEDRSLSSVGVTNPLIAQAIALEPFPDNLIPSSPGYDLEYAARQVAIWSQTNNFALTNQTVPNARLRARAQQLLTGITKIRNVSLQAAYHSVHVFVRETTANTVRLAVVIGLDPNTHLSSQQNIDLYLDGVRCAIRTRALTHISQDPNDTYHAAKPESFAPNTHSNDIAEVNLDRNTKVVDATATWVNVRSDPGLVLVSDGDAPPVLTAETAVLNFSTTTELDPAGYTNPEQLLSQVGISVLTKLPGRLVLVALLLALYLLPRVGRLVDGTLRGAWRRIRRRSAEPARVKPSTVEVEAKSQAEAVAAGMFALAVTSASEVEIIILQAAKHRLFGPDRFARVRLRLREPEGTNS